MCDSDGGIQCKMNPAHEDTLTFNINWIKRCVYVLVPEIAHIFDAGTKDIHYFPIEI